MNRFFVLCGKRCVREKHLSISPLLLGTSPVVWELSPDVACEFSPHVCSGQTGLDHTTRRIYRLPLVSTSAFFATVQYSMFVSEQITRDAFALGRLVTSTNTRTLFLRRFLFWVTRCIENRLQRKTEVFELIYCIHNH